MIKGCIEYLLKLKLVSLILSTLRLKFLKFSLLCLVSHWIKDIKDGICSSHEIWVVGVDVGVFNGDKVLHHLVAGCKRLSEEGVHDLSHSLSKVFEPVELWEFDFINYPP